MNAQQLIYEDSLASLEQADFCAVPGYLILRLKSGVESFADMSDNDAAALGRLLRTAISAIEQITGAERVYCLTFAELDRRLHFHLFPRTAALLRDYQQATGSMGEATNGPRLFDWARENSPAGNVTVEQANELQRVCRALGAALS